MKLKDNILIFLTRKRWIKRILINQLPKIAYKRIFNKIDFYFDPKDMKGPSFYFAYNLEEGLNNYEEIAKKRLIEFLPTQGVFYDIGANIGMYSVYCKLHKPEVELYAFEPESLAFSCLHNTLGTMEGKIFLYNKAIGYINEEKKIFKSPKNAGGHSFYNHKEENNNYEIVDVVNFDNFRIAEEIPLPHVIKIDVEGFELEVLRGIRKTILDSRPIMLIESNNEKLSLKEDFWKFMQEFEEVGLYVMEVESSKKLNMNELSDIASENFKVGKVLSDYFYCF